MLKHYLKLMLLFHSCHPISGVPWPDGKYGLPKPEAGCPHTANVTWEEGWILQDMVKESGYSHSQPFDLLSDLSNDIKRYFCMKTKTRSTDHVLWPPGKYCIYRKGGSCPANMISGYYYWQDEFFFNTNSQGGVYPDGEYSHNTQLYFCCRTDGDKNIPISLPTTKPFFLLAEGSSKCQQVKWALATAEWLIYDTAGPGKRGAVFPYNGWFKEDPKIYYCYYQSCNYNLNKDSGQVTSPNYPSPVPRGQFCSWRITVVPGYQVNLKFDVFSLSGNETDRVEVFDGGDDTAPALGVFTGNHVPPPLGVNSSSNTMFIVLRSSSTSEHVTGTNGGNFRALFAKREPPAMQTTLTAPTTFPTQTNTTSTETTPQPSLTAPITFPTTTNTTSTEKTPEPTLAAPTTLPTITNSTYTEASPEPTLAAPTTLPITTNTASTEKTPEPRKRPTQTSGKSEHVTTESTEPLPTAHTTGNSSVQGGLATPTLGGGMLAVAIVVPLVLVLAAITVFVLYRKRLLKCPAGSA